MSIQDTAALPPAMAAPSGRYAALDSLRGIAALIVVFFHCWMTLRWSGATAGSVDVEWLFRATPLRIVTAGMASVGLFFTLSGLVLALPWARAEPTRYGQFLAKRFFRLYVPFAAAIALAALLNVAIDPEPLARFSDWFNSSWNQPLTLDLLQAHFLMFGTQRGMSLDNVMWSLVHEARISILFPLLIAATIARPAWVVATSVAAFLAVSSPGVFGWVSGQLAGPGALWGVATILDTLRYGIYFVAGILMALHLKPMVQRFEALGRATRTTLWVAAGAMLLARLGSYSDGAWMLGAALLIALSMSSMQARRILAWPPFRWLGRVSYSLYLVHLPILLAVLHLAHDRAAPGWLLACVLALALPGAEFFNRLVEQPSQRLGRHMGNWLAGPDRHIGAADPAASR